MNFNFNNILQAFRSFESQPSFKTAVSQTGGSQLGSFSGQAIVEQIIQPDKPGRVRFKGSRWSARCDQQVTIAPGEVVDVVGVQKITLLVEPAFLLSACKIGLAKIREAIEEKGWTIEDPEELAESGIAPVSVLPSGDEENAPETIATETWKRFIQGKPIYITTFKACCKELGLDWKQIVGYGDSQADGSAPVAAGDAEAKALKVEVSPDLSFVGRGEAIADLTQLVDRGVKLITILGEGGIGKTTLARQYFYQTGFELVLECWMAKETQNVVSAESVVQAWLQQHFKEEPAREFSAALEQLRRKLQESTIQGKSVKIGVLLDNLEPAMDRQGRLIEERRGYVSLLEVLSDPTIQSLTLLTSREPLHEPTVEARSYILSGLGREAWQRFFSLQQLQVEASALEQMHQAYSGNAKAMTILSSAISIDFSGNMAAFWQEHQTNLLYEADLKDLVSTHFNRLQQVYPEAYQLLCRLGCYRYQEVATIPVEAMYCLLWDVPEAQHRGVVRFLRDLFVVEPIAGKYRLHPTIQAEAIAILKASPDWEPANRRAAKFWTEQIQTVTTAEDALTAFEAYYHYVQIDDIESAAAVILQGRDNQWEKGEALGISFYRLGLLRRMISSITRIIDRVQPGYALSKLHNILGDLYWLKGDIHDAIASHQKSREVASAFRIRDLETLALFNIGLCKIALWEVEEAFSLFSKVNTLAENTDWHMYAVGSWFCLAFLNSQLGNKQEAFNLIRRVSQDYSKISASSWSRGYSLLFLGLTLRNLDDFERAIKMFNLAKDYAEQSGYNQVKAFALNGLATICRDRQDFKAAIANHLAAKRLLERIEAKGDLAEVYYQLGLTYQQINEPTESRASLQAAIDLFQQMNAPKQVQRVQAALASVKSA